jgi:hypothetical protein
MSTPELDVAADDPADILSVSPVMWQIGAAADVFR